MADKKHLTKDDLIDTLADFYHSHLKPEFDGIKSQLNQLDIKTDKLEVEIRWIKDELKGIKAEISNMPIREEFDGLKRKVDRYHPTN